MCRHVLAYAILVIGMWIRPGKLQNVSFNSTRRGRSIYDSPEIFEFSEDRYKPRFYLDRLKNRYNYFESEFYGENETMVSKDSDRFFGTDLPSTSPLTWHDFPQLINNKLATVHTFEPSESTLTTPANHPTNTAPTSIMANHSHIVPKFPIYFTNPSTGAVYAISEVKKSKDKNESDGITVFSDGSTKSFENGNDKYTLQCTMVDMLTKPTKKTIISQIPSPLPNTTKRPGLRKKSKKKSSKKRTTTVIKYEDPPVVEAISNVMNNAYDRFENAMTKKVTVKSKSKINSTRTPAANVKRTKLSSPNQPPATRNPASTPFSKKRRLTKRMVPITPPTITINTTQSTPVSTSSTKRTPNYDDSYYLGFDDFGYDDSDYDYSTSNSKKGLSKTQKRRGKKKSSMSKRPTGNGSKDEDSSSSSVEVMDYVNDMISPIQDAFKTISKKAKQLLSPAKDTKPNKVPSNPQPQYTFYNAEQSQNVTPDKGNTWFGSWFQSDGMSKNQPTTTVANPEPGWFDYWYGDESEGDEDVTTTESSYDIPQSDSRWFFNWFGGSTTAKPTTTTTSTTTTTTTTTPKPFLSIIDPVQNAPEWFGILAQNLINTTLKQKSTVSPHTEEDKPHKISYDGYQIWRLNFKSESEVRIMEKYKNSGEGAKLQWLQGPSMRGPTDVLIPPKMITDFLGSLNYEGIDRDILIFDLGKAISYDISTITQEIYGNKNKLPMSWTKYHRYEDIIHFLEYVQMKHPNLVELIHVGRSYEGRPLIITKISNKDDEHKNSKNKTKKRKKEHKPSREVFIEAGSHGREWIGPATATWIIKELIRILRSNNTVHEPIRNSTWYILPVLNPDGYEYTHEYDRFWRKSRSRHISKPSGIIDSAMAWLQTDKKEKICYGVDLNRNWDYKWGQKGSSKSPCNEFFAGPNIFSEPETKAISKFIVDNRKNIKLFVSLHAYGHIISYPNFINKSYNAQKKIDDLMEVALVGMEGLRNSGSRTRYRVNAGDDMKAARSGTSEYFAMYEASIPFSYSIDLSDDGIHGFLLPSSFIEPTAKEAFEIIKSMVDYI